MMARIIAGLVTISPRPYARYCARFSACLSEFEATVVPRFCISTLSLDPYPRIAGDSHILFQPITAISPLLDLIGPLPQGRRLFGPTVLESKRPSRGFPIFSCPAPNRREILQPEKRQRQTFLLSLLYVS